MSRTRQVLVAFLAAFAVIAVVQHPTTSAHHVRAAGGAFSGAVTSVVDFFDALSA